MPLYKKKPLSMSEAPKDLDPHEPVFQVRFTKELFRDYEDYLKRVNLYRQRVWRCKVTGKSNLTYEEALVSEHRATENVQQFPKDLMPRVLHMIQFSTSTLNDLVNEMYYKLQESLFEGLELQGRKDDSVYSCKILKILDDENTVQYQVGWFDKDKKIIDSSIVKAEDLIHKKRPFSRRVLKEFIKESTYQTSPWVVHENVAKKHGIMTEPPEELRDILTLQNGRIWSTKKKWDFQNSKINKKRKEAENGNLAGPDKKIKKDNPNAEPVRYPIDDLLVCPAPDDPIFTERPPLSLEFNVPMNCVGDLLMVWDFCCTFGKLLHLWPFSLDDLENAICHKDSNLTLIVELHSSILQLLIKDEGDYFLVTRDKKRKSKIRLINWAEFLCDFVEMRDREELSGYVGTIKRGHYGLLEAHIKLRILRELVAEALGTDAIRVNLEERVEQQQALAAVKRDEARRQKEELLKMENSDNKGTAAGNILENGSRNDHSMTLSESYVDYVDEVHISDKNHIAENREKKHYSYISAEAAKKLRMGDGCNSEGMKAQRRGKDKDKETPKPEATKEHLEREIEKLSVRTNSLGKDRNHNRYWFFRRERRLFVESSDSMQWGYYSTKEELDALLGSLNPKAWHYRRDQKILLRRSYLRKTYFGGLHVCVRNLGTVQLQHFLDTRTSGRRTDLPHFQVALFKKCSSFSWYAIREFVYG